MFFCHSIQSRFGSPAKGVLCDRWYGLKKTRVPLLATGEHLVILSFVFRWYRLVTDERTDRGHRLSRSRVPAELSMITANKDRYRIQSSDLNITAKVSKNNAIHRLSQGHGKTSSSAVAKRPRDASCLSVVSFNIPTSQFFYY